MIDAVTSSDPRDGSVVSVGRKDEMTEGKSVENDMVADRDLQKKKLLSLATAG